MNQVINYSLLGRAVELYAELGYEQIEVDWMVPYAVSMSTHNSTDGIFPTVDRHGNDLALVGSAEQGFLKAVVDGRIVPDRKYMSVSPCFRRGDIGPINQECFIKLELSAMSLQDESIRYVMMNDAHVVFQQLGLEASRIKVFYEHDIDTDRNLDFVFWQDVTTPVELGSYGFREIKGLTDYNFLLHYGTGLALPRFQLINET